MMALSYDGCQRVKRLQEHRTKWKRPAVLEGVEADWFEYGNTARAVKTGQLGRQGDRILSS